MNQIIARCILEGLFYGGKRFVNVRTFIQNIILIEEMCHDYHSLVSAYSCDFLPKSHRHTPIYCNFRLLLLLLLLFLLLPVTAQGLRENFRLTSVS
jgi:hypothetical protein